MTKFNAPPKTGCVVFDVDTPNAGVAVCTGLNAGDAVLEAKFEFVDVVVPNAGVVVVAALAPNENGCAADVVDGFDVDPYINDCGG